MYFCDSLREFGIGFGALERLDLLQLQDPILIGDDVNEENLLSLQFQADGSLRLHSDL